MILYKKTPLFLTILLLGATLSFGQNTYWIPSIASPGGANNVLIGPANAYSFATASNNVAIGKGSGVSLGKGSRNVLLGDDAGNSLVGGSANLFVGAQAGSSSVGANDNVFVGFQAGTSNTSGSYNSFVGVYAGQSNTIGEYNSFFGKWAGASNVDGHRNTFIGTEAGRRNNSGNDNAFMGIAAGAFNLTGNSNTFLGGNAGYANTKGSYNTFLGFRAGQDNTLGSYNTFLGYDAGKNTTSGGYNAFLGQSTGGSNVSGDYNTFIGQGVEAIGPNAANLQRATALGHNARVGVNDGLVLGDTVKAKIGIGTAYPDSRLTIRGNINMLAYDNSMMLQNRPFLHWDERENLALGLGAEIPATATHTLVLGGEGSRVVIPSGAEGASGLVLRQYAQSQSVEHFLMVDERGKVILSQPRVRVAEPDAWADHVFQPGYALRPVEEAVAYGRTNLHLPGLPSADEMAAEGRSLEALVTAQMEKIEELTLYLIELEKENRSLQTKAGEIDELRVLVEKVQASLEQAR